MGRLHQVLCRAAGQLLNVGDGNAAGAGVGAHHAADVASIDLIRLQMGRKKALSGLELFRCVGMAEGKAVLKVRRRLLKLFE